MTPETPALDTLLSAHPADERALLDEQIDFITAMLALLASAPKAVPPHGGAAMSATDQLRRDIARTDTVMLHSLRAGFLRMGTDACLESAEVIAAEITRRTDSSCEAWARNLRLPIDGRRLSVSAEERRDAEFRRRVLAVRGGL